MSKRSCPRSAQIIVDESGDSRSGDPAAVAEAMERFKELTGLGYTAANRTLLGTARKVTEFDPANRGAVLAVSPSDLSPPGGTQLQ